ncbi:hypothetical protein Tco_1411629, partial [Tanacetum coccineum]
MHCVGKTVTELHALLIDFKNEDDVFTVNEMFSSKCYKVKVGNGTVGVANMVSEPKKQETVTEAAHKERDPGKL